EAEAVLADGTKRAWVLGDYAGVCSVSAAAAREDSRLPDSERLVLAEKYAARAVDLLAQAHAAGRLTTPAAVAGLQNDGKFEPLPSRADFQELLVELAAANAAKPANARPGRP